MYFPEKAEAARSQGCYLHHREGTSSYCKKNCVHSIVIVYEERR